MREDEGGRGGMKADGGDEGGRGDRRRQGREREWDERRTALVRELTCSHSLNSSAVASSLSDWGRWISPALHRTSLPRSSLPRSSPIPLLAFSARRGGRKEKKQKKKRKKKVKREGMEGGEIDILWKVW